ncbi:MAG: SDR family oxidoreductase [Bacillaceae bacterium]|nr:SDR family oxidoreductase [Bacillaceae bacterium]
MKKGTTLVTGITGNTGGETARALLAAGKSVKGAARHIEKASRAFGDHDIEWVTFDFMNPGTYRAALAGVESIFLVRPPAISEVKRYMFPFIDEARRAGVEKIVFLSLLGVERNPFVPHYKIEKYIKKSGIPYTFLRASFFMQNLLTFMRDDICFRREIFVPAGKGKTSFIDVRDIAEVATLALTEEGHVNRAYALTGNEALNYMEVARILSEELGVSIRYANPSLSQYKKRMRAAGKPEAFIKVTANIYTLVRMGVAGKVTEETEQLLKRPPGSLRQYVRDYKRWFLK